jgi:hypothetical protein
VDFLIGIVLLALVALVLRAKFNARGGRGVPRSTMPEQAPTGPSRYYPTLDISNEIQDHPAPAPKPILEPWQQSRDSGIFGIRDRLEQGRPLSREQEFHINTWTADWTDEERAAFIERASRRE